MRMPVMQVGIVRVLVDHRCVPVPMRMRLASRSARPMSMMVMVIMLMPMLVRHFGMRVLVLMPFGDVQIDTEHHQGTCGDQAECDWFAKYGDGQDRADEGRC